jgi:hypothetical protein
MMGNRRHAAVLLLSFLISGCASQTYECRTRGATVMVVGENAREGSIAPESQVFDRLAASMSANLTGKGYRSRDDGDLVTSFPEYFGRYVVSHDDDDLVEMVRSLRGMPTDVVAVMEVNVDTEEKEFLKRLETTVSLRLLDVDDGGVLGRFRESSEAAVAVRPDCVDHCLMNAVVDNARPVLLRLSEDVAETLACAGTTARRDGGRVGGLPTAYSITLAGFTSADVARIEDELMALRGYRSHRTVSSGPRFVEWWYETSLTSASLNATLRNVCAVADARCVTEFSGGAFKVQKVAGGSRDRQRKTSLRDEGW